MLFILAAALVLAGCLPGNMPGAGSMPLETATQPAVPREAATFTAVPALATATSMPRPRAERVVIISFDGLRPDAIGKAPMNTLLALMQVSAYTLHAQTILPSATLPAHASMLDGMCPAKHGVYWNDYVPENGYAIGTDLFDVAHAAGLRTVMVVGKEKLRQVTEPESTDVFVFKEADSSVANVAVREMANDFGLMFIHFPSGDLQGHEWGWMGAVQMWTFREEDKLLARILNGLDANGLRAGTLIIISADHGGLKHSHGGDLPEETTIPWLVSGPGVIPGELTRFVQTTDTAATAAWALNLPLPAEWDGTPVMEAFGLPEPMRAQTGCQQTR